jgi:chemotaxis protein CheC
VEAQEIMKVWQRASVPALATAGRALKQFSGLDFGVTETAVSVVPWSTMADRLKRNFPNPLYAVHLEAVGLFQAHILMAFSDSNAGRLVSALMGEMVALPLDTMGLSALGEVGNVVGTAFLNVFSDMFQSVWEPTTPRVLLTTAENLILEVSAGTRVLLTEAVFQVTDEEVSAEIVIVPSLA